MDFAEGTLVSVNYDPPNSNQLQLDSAAEAFGFIWVAASARGTVVKIDTNTGDILGEYRTSPNQNGNPSRTTVDNDGSVWVANRNDVYGGMGSVVHIGLLENNQCQDRNGDGIIQTSTALGDIRDWTSDAVADADDECIVHYTKVNSQGTRHVSVDENNDVWVSGTRNRAFDLVKGGRYDVPGSGTIIRPEVSVNYGGYGGLIDPNGVIWSARPLLRWDTVNTLDGPNGDPDPSGPDIGPPVAGTKWSGQSLLVTDSYGLCIDSQGNVWNSEISRYINKYDSDGVHLGRYDHHSPVNGAQGCVVDGNDDVWVAHSLLGTGATTVAHLKNDGTWVGNVNLPGGRGPTGVAVDRNGKIWVANIYTNNVMRIDPTLGLPGTDGVTPIGAVDLTVDLGAGAGPYNYSDMTGSTLTSPPKTGTWTVQYNGSWRALEWNALVPNDTSLTVRARSSPDGIAWTPYEIATNGGDLNLAPGDWLEIQVNFERDLADADSPVLYDLTVCTIDHRCKSDPLYFLIA